MKGIRPCTHEWNFAASNDETRADRENLQINMYSEPQYGPAILNILKN